MMLRGGLIIVFYFVLAAPQTTWAFQSHKIEAESASFSRYNYRVASYGRWTYIETMGKGRAELSSFPWASGHYTIDLGILAEDDGRPLLEIEIGPTKVYQLEFPKGDDFRSPKTIQAGTFWINEGETITIHGTRVDGGAARLDWVRFTEGFVKEAEDLDLSAGGYKVESKGALRYISTYSSGTASFDFHHGGGYYTFEFQIILENDGRPEIEVWIDDTRVFTHKYDEGNSQRDVARVDVGTHWVPKNATVRIVGHRRGDAAARIDKIHYRPINYTSLIPEACQNAPERVYTIGFRNGQSLVRGWWETENNSCDSIDDLKAYVLDILSGLKLDSSASRNAVCYHTGTVDAVYDEMDTVWQICEEHCSRRGVFFGNVVAVTYCQLSLALGGLGSLGDFSRGPVTSCGAFYQQACDDTYYEITHTFTNDLGECVPYTTGEFYDVWEETRQSDCYYGDIPGQPESD